MFNFIKLIEGITIDTNDSPTSKQPTLYDALNISPVAFWSIIAVAIIALVTLIVLVNTRKK